MAEVGDQRAVAGWLGLDADELVSCVQCGMCLPHCPTFRVTGDELASPRGRIALMRLVEAGELAPDAAFVDAMATCVQCRGCETACPSAVPYGRLMEGTRAALAARAGTVPWWQRLGLRALGHHRLLLAGSAALGVAQRLGLVPRRLAGSLPARLPLRQRALRSSGGDVWLHTGCVMDAWQREVHAATIRVLEAAGAGVAVPPAARSGCCGALHAHAGLAEDARARARRTMALFPGDAPVLVDSAGCGAAMRDYGHLLGTPEAAAFSARVADVHEWLATRLDRLPEASGPTSSSRPVVAVQDPCHLRHVQRAHQHVRSVLARYVDVVELDDEGLCCGAGGAYAALQPALAGAVRERKVAAIARSGAPVVASANPGCSLHLDAALRAQGVEVEHPMVLVDRALRAGHTLAP